MVSTLFGDLSRYSHGVKWRNAVSVTLILILMIPVSAISVSSAALKAGAVCKTVGQKKVSAGKSFTCLKKGKKLVWSKGVTVSVAPKPEASPTPSPVPTPSASPAPTASATPTPIPTPSPTPTVVKNLSSSVLITKSSDLSDVKLCKTIDATGRADVSMGFPRAASAAIGKLSARILFLPISFTDFPFQDSDYANLRSVADQVSDFYLKSSYGKVALTFDVLDKPLWVNMGRSAESYNLPQNKPQQNNEQVVVDALRLADASINFGIYDGVVVETGRFQSTGGAQGFPGQTFQTKNGVAKGVSLEFGTAVARAGVLAHELGHALFGLEDLYVFLNANRPSVPDPLPAGPWDMMSNSHFEFFGWSKYLMGWIEDSQVRCIKNQSSSTHYLESIEINSSKPKLTVINLMEGVSLAFETRLDSNSTNVRGLLVYKIDTRIAHGDGPVIAQKRLLLAGDSLQIDGWAVKVVDTDPSGVLIELSK